ncbi:universal stress protein [Pseudodesulfovibrio senegalensis]|jgi:hypothetical protein|uniref:Universal stress protein n=1 Tax=Pseudodesulfovibrio senegalensis TaxID=1721087 RepID=A0A6N6N0Z0_9BACT|nr:universal stress protein [Pseudodesulfovibrio senegalensis]KAB1441537.1 universal stress protein [Pseudodesulfovibrio senegalensis]
MEKHILVTLTQGPTSSYSLRFIHELFAHLDDVRLTLFYVTPRALNWDANAPDMTPSTEVEQEIRRIKSNKAAPTLNKARQWLLDVAGVDPDKVDVKTVQSRKGVVREIIDEAHSGLYDAVALGRKGFSWFETLFEDSISHEILWREIDFPIWICKRPPEGERRNVLLCVDGSAPSLRMADHVGYMLREQEEQTVTLFHVAENNVPMDNSVQDMFGQARSALMENGLPEERIEYKVVTSKNVAHSVINEACKSNYAAIALGKRGNSPKAMDNFFPSSLCIRLMRLCETTSLWISK